MDDAAKRMERGHAAMGLRSACMGDEIYAVFCEIKYMDSWFGLNCGQPLDDSIGLDCPVSTGPTPRCVLPEILGENVNVSNLEYVAAPLRIRLGHLIILNALCDDGWGLKRRALQVAPYIANRSVTVYENADTSCWPEIARTFAAQAADDFGTVGWPTSSGDKKYQRLAQKIANEMETLWNRKNREIRIFYALVFYPCTKADCPIIYDEDYSKWGNGCKDGNEKLRRLIHLQRQHANILLWHSVGYQCKTLLDNDEWMKKWESGIGALLNSTTNINPTEALKKVDEFLGADTDRAWRASDGGPFRAMLAVACAYKFVWTELTWHFFTASSSTPSYDPSGKLEPEKHIFVGGQSLTSKCLELVFVP